MRYYKTPPATKPHIWRRKAAESRRKAAAGAHLPAEPAKRSRHPPPSGRSAPPFPSMGSPASGRHALIGHTEHQSRVCPTQQRVCLGRRCQVPSEQPIGA